MKGGAGVSPRLSEAKDHLDRRMKADAVNRKLGLRPDAGDLEASTTVTTRVASVAAAGPAIVAPTTRNRRRRGS